MKVNQKQKAQAEEDGHGEVEGQQENQRQDIKWLQEMT